MTSIGTWVLHATSYNVEVQHVWTLISNIFGWGGRNVSTQFRNLQVHMAKVFRAQFLLQDSSISVTLMNITGDIFCCYQTQSETLQDSEMELMNPKGPMLHHLCGVTLLDFYTKATPCHEFDLSDRPIWRFRWRSFLIPESFLKRCETLNLCHVRRASKAHGQLQRPGNFPCAMLEY